MARSDLLIQLVQSGSKGDKSLFKKVVEAIIADERSKQHHILADKLQEHLNVNSLNNGSHITYYNGNSKNIDTRIDHYLYDTIPKLGFQDLILDDSTKDVCLDMVEEQARADLLRSYNIEPRNRALLVGPPGNGKTSLAEAIANALMVPLFSVKYEGVIGSYLGETSTRLKALFDYVKTQRCVLFFDEFDAIGKERGDKHETGEIKRVVSSLLLQIDQLPSYVVVIAATNHPELLDKAVWRRFQIKVMVPKPENMQIQIFINKFESAFNISFGYSSKYIAQHLNGYSFSEVQDFCQDILRKYILSLPNSTSTLKDVTRRRLEQLNASYKPSTNE